MRPDRECRRFAALVPAARSVAIAAVFVGLAMLPTVAAQDLPLSDLLIPGEKWQLAGEGFKFTEGPAADKHGNIYFTDIPENKIHRLENDGKISVFVANSLRTNGLMFGPGGMLFGCRNGSKDIVAFDVDGSPKVLATDVMSNDLVVTREGNVYFTDPDNKQVWFLDARGTKRVVDTGIERPNGIILWPDQKTLVVADTAGAHLWTFRVEADGSLSCKQPYYTMQIAAGKNGSGADGMTVDTTGRIYVCTHVGLQVFDMQGRLSGIIESPQRGKFLSNVEFGGKAFDTLFVTSTDRVYRRKVNATGVRYVD